MMTVRVIDQIDPANVNPIDEEINKRDDTKKQFRRRRQWPERYWTPSRKRTARLLKTFEKRKWISRPSEWFSASHKRKLLQFKQQPQPHNSLNQRRSQSQICQLNLSVVIY